MTNRTIDLGVDLLLFASVSSKLLLIFRRLEFPIELGHLVDRTQVRIRVAVTGNTPRHRQLFGLIDRFHLVDSAMARLATNTGVHVCGVVEVDEPNPIQPNR